jgi:DNA adenine methylase
MRYAGGKFRCYQKLINLIPRHRVYIESHLGGGAVLRNKIPAERTVGIDPDPKVIASFKGFAGSYRFICGRAEAFFQNHKFAGDEFVYADPPYWPPARASKRPVYRFDYRPEDHICLLNLLGDLPCKVMLSGYNNPLYDEMLVGWKRQTFAGTSHIGRREESVWLNYTPGEVHDVRYLGQTFRERQGIKRKRQRWVARFSREPAEVQQAVLADLTGAYANRQRGKEYAGL